MKINCDCFVDEEIKQDALNNSVDGICEWTGRMGRVIDVEHFEPFLVDLLSCFQPQKNRDVIGDAKNIVAILQEDWKIFKDDNLCSYLCNLLLLKYKKIGYSVDSLVEYIDSIKNKYKIWEGVKQQVMYTSRFFTNSDDFSACVNLERYQAPLYKDRVLFRARINPVKDACYKKDEMGCPKTNITSPGRANPEGIPYLYLCEEKETTCYEVRSTYLDNVNLGKFRITRDLNIINFSSKISLYNIYIETNKIKDIIGDLRVFKGICKDLSKPLRRSDSTVEYVPTQWLCEYLKVGGNIEEKIDGICFESSLRKGRLNYVLFNPEDAICEGVDRYEVSKVDIEMECIE